MSDWEVWDEDEEVVSEEEEEVAEEFERIDEDEEVVSEDEEVIAKPEGDVAELYAHGLSDVIPRVSETRRWLEWLQSYRQYKRLAEEARKMGSSVAASRYDSTARRYGDLVFHNCPYKPHRCPLYSLTMKCIVGMEKACRVRAWRPKKPRRVR